MQQYAGVYLLQNYSTCFWCPSHPSSGVHITVTAASGTGHITYLCNSLPPTWPIGHVRESRDSSVGIKITLQVDWPRNRGLESRQAKNFSPLKSSRPTARSTQQPIQCVSEEASLAIKQSWCKFDRFCLSNAKVKNVRSYTSNIPYLLYRVQFSWGHRQAYFYLLFFFPYDIRQRYCSLLPWVSKWRNGDLCSTCVYTGQ